MSARPRPPRPGAAEKRASMADEDAMVLGALRRAIAAGTKITSFRDFVRQAGVATDRAHAATVRLMREHVTRDTLPGDPPQTRLRLSNTTLATPWATKRAPKPKAPMPARRAPANLLVGKGKFLHPVQQSRRDESRRVQAHQRRMAAARVQSEDELRALVDAHIHAHGVTRIQPTHEAGAAPMPVGTRSGMLGISDGASKARSR